VYRFVLHYGSFSSGHYKAVIETGNNKWMMFDDSHVTEIRIESFSQKKEFESNVYQMMFVRIDEETDQERIKDT
jgi:ubiquitin C-terminal hydrolase